MKIKLTIDFQKDLMNIVAFISSDKPLAARKFKNDLVASIKKDLVTPYSYKKSIYFDNINYRDYVFKGYTTICKVDLENEIVYIIGVLKHKETL
jgi:plasmid stabilization system protein ParE